jgi:hypothetical protein
MLHRPVSVAPVSHAGAKLAICIALLISLTSQARFAKAPIAARFCSVRVPALSHLYFRSFSRIGIHPEEACLPALQLHYNYLTGADVPRYDLCVPIAKTSLQGDPMNGVFGWTRDETFFAILAVLILAMGILPKTKPPEKVRPQTSRHRVGYVIETAEETKKRLGKD